MKLTITGLAEAQRAFAQVAPTVHRELVALNRTAAEVAARTAAAAAPRRTGALAASIGVSPGATDLTWVASVGVPYAIHVEYGTSRSSAHPFMRPGALAAEVTVQRGAAAIAASLPEQVR